MRHVISVLLENEAGALSRVAGLFSARGYNIHSLNVAPTLDPTLSKMTIVSIGDDNIIDQIVKQLNKLIDVIHAKDISCANHLERELLLLKVENKHLKTDDFQKLISRYSLGLINTNDDYSTFELSSDNETINEFLKGMVPNTIAQITRTGVSGINITTE